MHLTQDPEDRRVMGCNASSGNKACEPVTPKGWIFKRGPDRSLAHKAAASRDVRGVTPSAEFYLFLQKRFGACKVKIEPGLNLYALFGRESVEEPGKGCKGGDRLRHRPSSTRCWESPLWCRGISRSRALFDGAATSLTGRTEALSRNRIYPLRRYNLARDSPCTYSCATSLD